MNSLKKPKKPRNPIAGFLASRLFKHRIVRDKTKYTRKILTKPIRYDI